MDDSNSTGRKVRDHFHRTAAAFDSIYSGDKGRLRVLLDRWFRRDMYERFELALRDCSPTTGKAVLDIGCGSGRFSIALAQEGAARVRGIDFAENMIEIAEAEAREQGVSERTEFVCGDFSHMPLAESFDFVLAIGVFDYVKDFVPLLGRMAASSRGKLIATFPRLWTWRSPIRKLRLHMSGCPVYFYRRRQLLRAARELRIDIIDLRSVGKIFYFVGKPKRGEAD